MSDCSFLDDKAGQGNPEGLIPAWRIDYWGMSTSLDIYHCSPIAIRSAEHIEKVVIDLCKLIGMKRFGPCNIVHFGEEERIAGFSMTQLIETSLISGHFANATNAVYIDVFSCCAYDPNVVQKFLVDRFGGMDSRMVCTPRYK